MIVTDMYYGTKRIVAVYLGSKLIYEKDTSIADIRRSKLDIELDLQGNVVSLHAVPVSPEAEIALGVEAEVTTRPIVPAAPEAGFTLGVEAEEIYTPEAARLPMEEDGVTLGIEAEVYVYNKAEIRLDDGVEIDMESQAMAGEAAHVDLFEDLSIDLKAEAQAPEAVPLIHEENAVQLAVGGTVSTPDICPVAGDPEPIALGVTGELHALDACLLSALAGIQLDIEAIVTVLPVASIAAELTVELGSEATVDLPDTEWTDPVQTETNLYIRQVSSAVQTGTTLKLK